MKRRLATALGIFLAVVVVGTIGYVVIEGWGFLDALYMTVVSITTVGYREVHPLTTAGRVYTMLLLLGGIGALLYAFGTLLDFLVEGHLRGLLEGRRMEKRLSGLSGHHIVAGIGRVGTEVARSFADKDAPFVVIDNCDDCAERARQAGWPIVVGDATEEEVLESAGICRAASLVAALDTDADNVFVALTGRTLNPDLFIVARASTASAEVKLRKAGANRVITPTVIGGKRMAAMVLNPLVSDYLDLVTRGERIEFRLEEVELTARSALVGRTLGEGRLRDETGTLVLAVHNTEGGIRANPPADTVLSAGDRLVVLGTEAQLAALGRML